MTVGPQFDSAKPHTLYWIYDTNNVLLYIGVTAQPVTKRINYHRCVQQWGNQIHTWATLPIGTMTRRNANQIEGAIIRAHRPTYNIRAKQTIIVEH